ncbi:MAG: hypothetical protein M1816_008199 [Peltula sp. TS41687]|nr:MAG: hypothetical protein M1816_008199 [Peltula sp. TS41687]
MPAIVQDMIMYGALPPGLCCIFKAVKGSAGGFCRRPEIFANMRWLTSKRRVGSFTRFSTPPTSPRSYGHLNQKIDGWSTAMPGLAKLDNRLGDEMALVIDLTHHALELQFFSPQRLERWICGTSYT